MRIYEKDFIIEDENDTIYILDHLTKESIGIIRLISLKNDGLELVFQFDIDLKKDIVFNLLNTILPDIFKKNKNCSVYILKNQFSFEDLLYYFGFSLDRENKYYELKEDNFLYYAYDFKKEDYIALRKLVDWITLDDKKYQNIIDNSAYKIAIINQNKIVGMARCITDFAYLYLLCDVMISPLMQGKGLGRRMVQCFIHYIKTAIGNTYAKIYIMSLKGKEGFYKALGFKEDIATGLTILCEEKENENGRKEN